MLHDFSVSLKVAHHKRNQSKSKLLRLLRARIITNQIHVIFEFQLKNYGRVISHDTEE